MFKRNKDKRNDETIASKVNDYKNDNPYKYGLKYYNEVEKHNLNYDAEAASEQLNVEDQQNKTTSYKNELKRDISEIDAQLKNLK